ncbi:ATP-binding protein [Cognatishimia activa]|uniref:ATP-binding protein n=1 Tax=Cognatishimia activa TaxID=1715691 RepID=UPI0022306134|nr:ATP-binding protein [Cognatishimia activa]UZD91677.1 ATP-binding protein [Cognatishimia activa]
MGSLNALVAVCLIYVAFLFGVAFAAERATLRGKGAWLQLPLVYTLSLSVYCTAWTFYGAVGYAARSGLEYLTIYIGPSLVLFGWWWFLRKLVRIGRSQRITSIADMISSRYGKSNMLAVGVTILAVIGTTPYIALQLQSVTTSFAVFSGAPGGASDLSATALWVAGGLAVFTIIFGTRNLDANERHYGVVMAIAVEAVVKLFALLAVGVFVVWGIADGPSDILARIEASKIAKWEIQGGRWAGLIFLSAAAVLCLPRMFQVMVVENENEDHLRTASWAFPAYLMVMSLFVVPIAVVGLDLMPAGSNPDMFVLTLPLATGNEGLAMLSFLGGFSSATSMVIVAAIALSTMVSNHIVMPIWLSLSGGVRASISGDVRGVVLLSRRVSIAVILLLGYIYYRFSGGGTALASIGLISFAGVAQFLPVLVGGVFWRGATRVGALVGLTVGFVLWAYCLLLPSFGDSVLLPLSVMESGPLGIGWLKPQALFGISGLDPLIHAIFWSISLNALSFFLVSMLGVPSPLERLQGAQFVNIFEHSSRAPSWTGGVAKSEDLMIMAQRIMGAREAQTLFEREATQQGLTGVLPEPNSDFLQVLERELSGSVGAATAHAMIGQIVGGASVSVQDLMAVANETAQIMEYSNQLEVKSEELERTARQLRRANDKLLLVSEQKDEFLSQVSHELRTPMTSVRAFSEILRDSERLSASEKRKYGGIIHDEAVRLTRLLDDLLDLNVLENGGVSLNTQRARLDTLLDHAIKTAVSGAETVLRVEKANAAHVELETDVDRLSQVFINVIRNAQKYCDAKEPILTITVTEEDERVLIDFADNGTGIEEASQELIFEKFARVNQQKAGGAGLGLAICREIMQRLGGEISYLPGQGGAAFRVTIPQRLRQAAQ